MIARSMKHPTQKQKCCICKHLSGEIIDADNIYICPSCENMLFETIVKKAASCTVKVDVGNIEYFLNEKRLAAAGGAKALLKQRQYSISLKGD